MPVAVLAGLQGPTQADILAELPALLEELGASLPEKREALKAYVDAVAQDIVDGTVTPYHGAAQIRSVSYQDSDNELWDQFSTFYALAEEYEEWEPSVAELDPETVATAKAFLASGGLQIKHG